MNKKLPKSAKTAQAKYKSGDYNFDDGCEPRDLLLKLEGKPVAKKKLFHS